MEEHSWKFEATTLLVCFEKLESRFEVIGRSTFFWC